MAGSVVGKAAACAAACGLIRPSSAINAFRWACRSSRRGVSLLARVLSAAIAFVSRTRWRRVVAMSVGTGSAVGAAAAVTVWVILIAVAKGLQPAVALTA